MYRTPGNNSIDQARIAALLLMTAAALIPTPPAISEPLPPCLATSERETIQATVMKTSPPPIELLARLVHAEGRSTSFAEDVRVYQAIAWGVMNRVRLGEVSSTARRRYGAGIAGTIFRKGQFNPVLSIRSPFSRDFLCPQDLASWRRAWEAAQTALRGQDNPFIQTAWERGHGLSLVVNFYYPDSSQARGPLAPWEGNRDLRFIGEVPIGGTALPADRVRFYRLTTPPTDISD